MATPTTETSEHDDTERSTTAGAADDSSGGSAIPSMVVEQVKNGRLPILVGGVMALKGVRGLLSERGRGLGRTVTGLALFGYGLRRRSKADSTGNWTDISLGSTSEKDAEESLPGTETVSRRAESNEPGTNPRDVDDEPDVATAEDPSEGAVQFETERSDVDVERKPHLEEGDTKDPRYPDEGDPETDDGHVDVDISESALADEPNEAVGPDEEQAYPASEGTDPEPSAPKSPERAEGEEIDDPDATDEEGSESQSEDEESTADDEESTDDESDADVEESI